MTCKQCKSKGFKKTPDIFMECKECGALTIEHKEKEKAVKVKQKNKPTYLSGILAEEAAHNLYNAIASGAEIKGVGSSSYVNVGTENDPIYSKIDFRSQ